MAEITSLAEAFAKAQAESDATPSDAPAEDVLASEETVEASSEQVSDDVSEELSPDGPVVEELFSVEDLEEVEAPAAAPDLESVTFELPGIEEPVTVQDLKDGYLRQSDYTKKTQELAAERKANADAVRFWTQLNEAPVETVTALAAKLKLVPEGTAPNVEFEVSPFKSAAEVEAEVQRRVDEQVQQHPDVLQAREQASVRAVMGSLDAIEAKYDVKLGPESRKVLLLEAQRVGTTDLDFVYQAVAARKAKGSNSALKLASGQRGGTHVEEPDPDDKPVESIRDAFERAQRVLEMTG